MEEYVFDVVSSDHVNQENLKIAERNYLFSELPDEPVDPEFVRFDLIEHTAEVKEFFHEKLLDFDLDDLNNPAFIAEAIINQNPIIKNQNCKIEVILYLWSKPISFLNQVLVNLGYGLTGADKENAFTLIYWSLYLGYDIKIDLDLRDFIVLNDTETVISLYEQETGKEWEWTRDRATLIYVLYNNCSLPIKIDYTRKERYQEILNLDPTDFYKHFKYVYAGNYGFLSPTRYLCSVNKSGLEEVLKYSEKELIKLMLEIEYVPIDYIGYKDSRFYLYSEKPEFLKSLYLKLLKDRKILVKGFLKTLNQYKNLILKIDHQDLYCISDLKLLNLYKPELKYKDRSDLIRQIQLNLKETHVRFSHPYNRSNPDINVITQESRDIQSLISIGTLLNYEAYNLEELVESFKTGEFKKPDSSQYFSYSSMIKLSQVATGELSVVMQSGLERINNLEKRVQLICNIMISFAPQAREQIYKILVEYFFLGMYTRYWKGPGYEYPIIWNEQDVDPIERTVLVSRSLHYLLKTEFDSEIMDWIKLIPRVTYNWKTEEYIYGLESLYDITVEAANDNFCLTNYSNIALQTIYWLCKFVLKLDLNELVFKYYPENKYKFEAEKLEDTTHRDYTLPLKDYVNLK